MSRKTAARRIGRRRRSVISLLLRPDQATGFLFRSHLQLGVVRHLHAHEPERASVGGARHAADDLPLVAELLPGLSRIDLELAQAPVDLPAVAEPGDRLLARVAALR